ncbi:MAG TPA: hypothetical protein VN495_00110 [Candidatus Paceibacterota bacterium]|nr:hypothetical protein [Candidatus Paceibacterota bacterium]
MKMALIASVLGLCAAATQGEACAILTTSGVMSICRGGYSDAPCRVSMTQRDDVVVVSDTLTTDEVKKIVEEFLRTRLSAGRFCR